MEPTDYTLYFQNKGNHSIVLLFGNGQCSTVSYPKLLPQSDLWKKCSKTLLQETSFVYSIDRHWNEYIDSFPLDTIAVFVFEPDTLDAYPWEVIRDEYKVLKTHFITIDDVLKSDTIVIYP
jgi:hypothetical protein